MSETLYSRKDFEKQKRRIDIYNQQKEGKTTVKMPFTIFSNQLKVDTEKFLNHAIDSDKVGGSAPIFVYENFLYRNKLEYTLLKFNILVDRYASIPQFESYLYDLLDILINKPLPKVTLDDFVVGNTIQDIVLFGRVNFWFTPITGVAEFFFNNTNVQEINTKDILEIMKEIQLIVGSSPNYPFFDEFIEELNTIEEKEKIMETEFYQRCLFRRNFQPKEIKSVGEVENQLGEGGFAVVEMCKLNDEVKELKKERREYILYKQRNEKEHKMLKDHLHKKAEEVEKVMDGIKAEKEKKEKAKLEQQNQTNFSQIANTIPSNINVSGSTNLMKFNPLETPKLPKSKSNIETKKTDYSKSLGIASQGTIGACSIFSSLPDVPITQSLTQTKRVVKNTRRPSKKKNQTIENETPSTEENKNENFDELKKAMDEKKEKEKAKSEPQNQTNFSQIANTIPSNINVSGSTNLMKFNTSETPKLPKSKSNIKTNKTDLSKTLGIASQGPIGDSPIFPALPNVPIAQSVTQTKKVKNTKRPSPKKNQTIENETQSTEENKNENFDESKKAMDENKEKKEKTYSVAVKKMLNGDLTKEKTPEEKYNICCFLREHHALMLLYDQPRIVKVYGSLGAIGEEKRNGIVMKKYRGTFAGYRNTLLEKYPKKSLLEINFELSLLQIYDILTAALTLSQSQIIFRDYKSENILIDDNYRCVLSDFGTAKTMPVEEQAKGSSETVVKNSDVVQTSVGSGLNVFDDCLVVNDLLSVTMILADFLLKKGALFENIYKTTTVARTEGEEIGTRKYDMKVAQSAMNESTELLKDQNMDQLGVEKEFTKFLQKAIVMITNKYEKATYFMLELVRQEAMRWLIQTNDRIYKNLEITDPMKSWYKIIQEALDWFEEVWRKDKRFNAPFNLEDLQYMMETKDIKMTIIYDFFEFMKALLYNSMEIKEKEERKERLLKCVKLMNYMLSYHFVDKIYHGHILGILRDVISFLKE